MAWRKYFTTVPSQAQMTRRLEQINRENSKAGTSHKFSSYLPEVYAGAPNRIERYVQYDQADLDSEINRALDTIAEFCTQNQDDDRPIPFRFVYRGDLTETEVELLNNALQQWCSINKFNQRIWRIFRNTIKYGDQFFIRDPETYELFWVDSAKVEKIIVNEAEGKSIEQYVIRDLDLNLDNLTATNPTIHDNYSFPGGYPRSSNPAAGAGNINYGQPTTPGGRTSRFYNPANSTSIEGVHVVHCSLSEGMDQYWPFGLSILEAVYKTYKQKDLLEDCILIYRIVRAPERRVFYIDVGQLQGQRAMAYVERVKNEVYQRRMPNRQGGGSSILDTAYNPISITEDFFLATNSEQRGTKIESLAAGENLGCFSLDTKIKLLDGRDLSILDIQEEMQKGNQLWTYSCHPVTGEIAPGKITWAGKTRSSAKVLKITLDSGDTITCTPDHKFPLRGVGFVEAKDLPVGQSLIALYTRNKLLDNHCNTDYTQYYDHVDQSWEYVHRMVAKFMWSHKQHNQMLFDNTYLDMPQDTIHHMDHNRYNNDPNNLTWINWHDHTKDHTAYQVSCQAQNMLTLAAGPVTHNLPANDPTHQEFKSMVMGIPNSDSQNKVNADSSVNRHMLLKDVGKQSLQDYGMIKNYANTMNHKIIRIEYLEDTMDVGTLTVDGDNEFHDWHTYALSVGVFVKNSIDDLRYFNNKLIRGLGIPSSYLPSGPDDGTAVYSDGKVGTAFIQEYRFNKYCQRLQNAICPTFDREFKLFIKHRGLEISANLFELAFMPPQSFSDYSKLALETERANLYNTVMGGDAAKYLSKRWAMEKYLGLTEGDILENERLWKQENAQRMETQLGISAKDPSPVGLGAVGIKPEIEPELGTGLPPQEPEAAGQSIPSGGQEPMSPLPIETTPTPTT